MLPKKKNKKKIINCYDFYYFMSNYLYTLKDWVTTLIGKYFSVLTNKIKKKLT